MKVNQERFISLSGFTISAIYEKDGTRRAITPIFYPTSLDEAVNDTVKLMCSSNIRFCQLVAVMRCHLQNDARRIAYSFPLFTFDDDDDDDDTQQRMKLIPEIQFSVFHQSKMLASTDWFYKSHNTFSVNLQLAIDFFNRQSANPQNTELNLKCWFYQCDEACRRSSSSCVMMAYYDRVDQPSDCVHFHPSNETLYVIEGEHETTTTTKTVENKLKIKK